MTIPPSTAIEKMSHAELVALVKELITIVVQLQAENQQLRAEIEKLRQPPANSRNSGQPPSRDQKANLLREKKGKKQGPPYGHEPHQRKLSERADRVIEAPVKRCAHCRTNLRGCAAEIVRRQIVELPVVKGVIIETRQHEVVCPQCRQVTRGVVPAGLPAHGDERSFGPQLTAFIVYLRQMHHLSYVRLQELLREVYQIEISQGALVAIVRRAGAGAQPEADIILEAVAASPYIASDETSARVEGRNWWHWVFRSAAGEAHLIEPTRSAAVIEQVMGEQVAEVWTSDCFGSQLLAPAHHHQLCLAHLLRDLERVVEADGKTESGRWARRVQKLLRAAIHLRHELLAPVKRPLSVARFLAQVERIERRCDRLLKIAPEASQARRLWRRLLKHRASLFLFLYYPEVEPTNNGCERALRPAVIHRKVTNGFRSRHGAKGYAALRTIIDTARLKGRNILTALTALMGLPVLHFADPSPP